MKKKCYYYEYEAVEIRIAFRGGKCRYERHKNNDAGAEEGSKLPGSERKAEEE